MSSSLPDFGDLTDGLTIAQELQMLVQVAQDAFTAKVRYFPVVVVEPVVKCIHSAWSVGCMGHCDPVSYAIVVSGFTIMVYDFILTFNQ